MSDNKPVRMDAPAPEGFEGEGFFATKLSSVIGLAKVILCGLCHLQLHVVV
jgi:NADH-quinone oxidoreductase subunit B